jgi:hypothetical protein
MRTNLTFIVIAMVSASVVACGGGSGPTGAAPPPAEDAGEATEGGPVTTPVEAGAPVEAAAPVDHGAPSTTYPAFPVSFGQLQDNGGLKMTSPVIVAITWDSDPSQASFDSFADELGATSYWKQTSSEWGIGPAVSGMVNHVHISTAAPATLQDSDLQTMVSTNAGVTAGWPAATQDTIFAFFLPPSLSLLVQGMGGGSSDACSQGIGGYHDQVNAGAVTTSYAAVPSCVFPGGNSAAQQTTMSMSHEINEAASDPEPQANTPGVTGFENDSFAFDYFQDFQSENGDACEFFVTGPDSSFYEDTETTPAAFDYWVQRIWSNKSGAAGHNPCVPVPSDPYFNVTPLELQAVNVANPQGPGGSSSSANFPSKGYKALAGSSVTFPIGFYSDAATSGPWTLKATVGNPITGSQDFLAQYNKSTATVSIDKTSGQNGEKAYVTVKVTSSGSLFKGEMITVTSTLGGVSHYMPIWIAGQ